MLHFHTLHDEVSKSGNCRKLYRLFLTDTTTSAQMHEWTSPLKRHQSLKLKFSFRIDQGIAHATGRLCPLQWRCFRDTKGATYGINNMQPAGRAGSDVRLSKLTGLFTLFRANFSHRPKQPRAVVLLLIKRTRRRTARNLSNQAGQKVFLLTISDAHISCVIHLLYHYLCYTQSNCKDRS